MAEKKRERILMANVALHPEAEREYDKSYSLLTMQNMCNDCCVQQI